jgi:hypothetical protein
VQWEPEREHRVGADSRRGPAGHAGTAAAAAEDEPAGRDGEPEAHHDGGEGRVQAGRGSRRAPAGDSVGLLDPGDAPAGRDQRSADREQVRRLDPAAGAVAENDQPERVVDRIEMSPRRTDGRLDVENPGQRAASNFA